MSPPSPRRRAGAKRPAKVTRLDPGHRISIDALGGERGLNAIVGGMARAVADEPGLTFVLHGPADALEPLLAEREGLAGRVTLVEVSEAISQDAKPSRALRNGEGTSMWRALESVRSGEAGAVVSCGNTGALMALARLRLRMAPGIARPAIAVLWPAATEAGYCVVLDVGADVRADAADLATYALMGAAYARSALGLSAPRVGVLNVGKEEHKGLPELHDGAERIAALAGAGSFEAVGFVEGSDIPAGGVDVVVTDGFTGNVALKTAEGTASMTRAFLQDAFSHSPFSRAGALMVRSSLRRLSRRLDPRRVNGGVFLGLNGTVVKSHGGADATGIAAAIKLAFLLAQNPVTEAVETQLATTPPSQSDRTRDAAHPTAGIAAAKGGEANDNLEAL